MFSHEANQIAGIHLATFAIPVHALHIDCIIPHERQSCNGVHNQESIQIVTRPSSLHGGLGLRTRLLLEKPEKLNLVSMVY